MSKMLNVKDLITVGIFAVILTVSIFIFGMLGYIPILMIALPVIVALIAGIPYMLFLTRVDIWNDFIVGFGFGNCNVFKRSHMDSNCSLYALWIDG